MTDFVTDDEGCSVMVVIVTDILAGVVVTGVLILVLLVEMVVVLSGVLVL